MGQGIRGKVIDAETKQPIVNVELFDEAMGFITPSDKQGYFTLEPDQESITLSFFAYAYQIKTIELNLADTSLQIIELEKLGENLSEVVIQARQQRIFELQRMKDIEGTAIYAGKKTEVVLVEQSMANLATNNARQIYSQVAGLNIYQNDDAGLQLNVGGRGLDPNRTANFNTRQNGYDISADVLGYPESYYSPASEGVKEIQVIRGAASLQYGSQFGGLINFKMKEPNPDESFEVIHRNTFGSYDLYTNFTSISGTHKKWSYYTFFNHKQGDGFRPNSKYESDNIYAHIGYQWSKKTKLIGEFTYLDYLAQQAGGLTDASFRENPFQSNRTRNWFKVDWMLYNFKFLHQFSEKSNLSLSFFGLNASRFALGFRTNRVDQIDPMEERDLIKGDFTNYGMEARYLSTYQLLGRKATFLLGAKYYDAENNQEQGPGSDGADDNFNFAREEYPNYANQSQFDLPNLNLALFGEHVFYAFDQFSITPGIRFEHIKTESEGYFQRINTDGAGNVILNERVGDSNLLERSFVLVGIGLSYKPRTYMECYANLSQNYRSVTFSDINISNPAFSVSPTISDEEGFTFDLGMRGKLKQIVSYDLGLFALSYKDRIGFVQEGLNDGRVVSLRDNIGDALMYGLEGLIDINLAKWMKLNEDFGFSYFVNLSFIQSEYTSSRQAGIKGNKVEFVPETNLKTGLKMAYKNWQLATQYTYLSEQFTDASNAETSNISGVIGAIPSYDILDLSSSYRFKDFKLEAGINNVLDNAYFTRRATSYPGPGIIPSAPRNWYVGFELRF